jgi:hypothetical protein
LRQVRRQLAELGPPSYIGVTWRAETVGRRNIIYKEVSANKFATALKGLSGTLIAMQRLPAPGEIGRFSTSLEDPLHDLTALNKNLDDILALSSLLDEYLYVSNTNVYFRTVQRRTSRVLFPHPPEFRRIMEGDSSPWFVGTKIYRRGRNGD